MPEIIRHSPDRYRPARYCPDCGTEQLFGQHHGPAGWCPDTADRYCPEWYCLSCGAALLIGDFLVTAEASAPARIRARVA
jgi:hypothetical protein